RVRASISVGLVILSSIMEIAGPAIVAVAIDLYVKPQQGAHGISQRIGAWLVAHGWALDPLSGINLAAGLYFVVLLGGFAVLFSIIPLIILVSAWFRRGARITYRQTRVRIAAINAFLQEHISGMATVQLFNREADEAEKFEGLNARHRDANLQSVFYYSIFYPVVELIETIGLALIVWY